MCGGSGGGGGGGVLNWQPTLRKVRRGMLDFSPSLSRKQEKRCSMWVEQCGRLHEQLSASKMNESTFLFPCPAVPDRFGRL